MIYADPTRYQGSLDIVDAKRWMAKASSNIDVLTFRRIYTIGGIEKLHLWQRTIIEEVVFAYADWLADNEDMLDTYLKSYAINGVSMTMDGAWNVHIEQGVAMRSDLYALLETTGLCCRNVNW